MWNDDQKSWMAYLASLPREQKCDCGLDRRGHCCGQCYGRPEKGGAADPHAKPASPAGGENERQW